MHPRSRAARGRIRGRGPGPGRAQRVLDREELRLLLLSLFDDGVVHGYELIRKIKAKSRGAYAPSPGMVYPALADMAEEGLVAKAAEQAGRKTYSITAEGNARVAGADLQAITDKLVQLGRVEAGFHAPIERAIANLDLVLGNVAPDASSKKVDEIVTIIDNAARAIERLD